MNDVSLLVEVHALLASNLDWALAAVILFEPRERVAARHYTCSLVVQELFWVSFEDGSVVAKLLQSDACKEASKRSTDLDCSQTVANLFVVRNVENPRYLCLAAS